MREFSRGIFPRWSFDILDSIRVGGPHEIMKSSIVCVRGLTRFGELQFSSIQKSYLLKSVPASNGLNRKLLQEVSFNETWRRILEEFG